MTQVSWTTRPGPDEYGPFFERYVRLPPEGDVLETLRTQLPETLAPLRALPAGSEGWRPSPDRWSLGEVLGHLADFERVMAFRALWFARGAPGELGSMEQDRWVPLSGAGTRPLHASLQDLAALREATLRLADGFDGAALARAGVAAGARLSVRALFWIMAGHELHHRTVLARDYLPGVTG